MTWKAFLLIVAFVLFLLGAVLGWVGHRGAFTCVALGLALWEVTTIHIKVDS